MPFDKVDTQVDFPAQERVILAFWQRHDIFEKLRAKNRGKPKWSFLDGPITANNPMGVHHAWGRTYKDAYCRYQAMTGHELRYQNGFDCQGLWVEVEVEKEFKLKSKRDIENLVPDDTFASIDRFVRNCKERVDRFARIQTEQSIRLGYWMDWDRDEDWAKPPDQRRSYFTMSEENNYTIWSFLKKCHQRGLVYRAFDSMPWCPRCAVGLSQMEMHEGYQMVAHRSVFVRFPLRGRPNENLLIWTTTPWTLSSNVAAAVNPRLTYLKVRHREQLYYLAKGAFTAQRLEEHFKRKEWVEGVPKLKTLEQVFKEKGGYAIEGELPGSALVGWTYDGPFDELPAQGHPSGYPHALAEVVTKQQWAPAKTAREVHRVIAWDAVGETEGTGIVHIAPGCGKEDFLLGKEQGLPPVAPLDEEGVFLDGFGELTDKSAIDAATTDWILNNLQEKGVLLASERYPHSYPHCWRCKTELLFRLVDEWFINMSWRDEIMRVVEDVRFLPESINGKARELDWLRNMGDWMISKKRFWGLALPIWVDEQTGDFEVIGSREELKARAVEGWERFEGKPPHRPWVDLIKVRNPKTGNLMSRIPDVGNPWLDAGIVPFSTMGYNRDRAYWEKWFPADFITESFPGQFRNWFYAILAMSTMMEQRAPMKVLLGHALVRDEHGDEMHKSKGNAIPFEAAADEGWTVTTKAGKPERQPPIGADLMRWLYCRQNPAANLNFGSGPAEALRAKFTLKLWNTYAFFVNYARLDEFDPARPEGPVAERPDIDRWILSDLQLLIRKANESFRAFDVQAFCLEAENFVDDRLSNWYVRRNRRRFWKSERGADKLAAYQTLYTVLFTLTKLCAPVMPFLCEAMYQNLKTLDEPVSVHLCDYPEANAALIDEQLSADMDGLLRLVSLGSAARNTVKIKVRQPLQIMLVDSSDKGIQRTVLRFHGQIEDELNIKEVKPGGGKFQGTGLTTNSTTLGPKLGADLQKFNQLLREVTGELMAQGELATVIPERTLVGTKYYAVTQGFFERFLQTANDLSPDSAHSLSVLSKEDILLSGSFVAGWTGVIGPDLRVYLNTELTEELKLEGMAREVIRLVQQARKDANLEMEDRIALYLHTESDDLRRAIEKHKAYIAAETLTTQWATQPLDGEVHTAHVKIEGQALTIQLQRAKSG